MGVPVTSNYSNRDNCPKISTACVIWQGPDIPCIDLCSGDAVDEVVFKLATLLCDVSQGIIDVSSIEFSCLVASGTANPSNLIEALQLIINNLCTLNSNVGTIAESTGKPGGTGTGGTTTTGAIQLPECLFFENEDGDLVTALPVDQYVSYLAATICTIIDDVQTLQMNNINLTERVTELEVLVEALETYTYDIFVTSQCASNETPGVSMLIQDAFQNFEATFCNLQSTLGNPSLLVSAINTQCPDLNNLPQLSDSLFIMSDLPNWVLSPVTVADSITNMWLTMCDMRAAVVNLLIPPPANPCILVPQINTTVSAVTTTYATVTWEDPASNISGIESPIGYRIEVFEWTGTAITGPVLFSNTYNSLTFTVNISDPVFVPLQDYAIRVYAIYNCGEAEAVQVISNLVVPTILFKIAVTTADDPDTSMDCLESGSPVSYTQENKTTTIELQNFITGLPVTAGVDLDVVLSYEINGCDAYGPTYDHVTLTILSGNSTATYSFASQYYINCGTLTCTPKTKDFSCGLSIDDPNTQFDTSVPVC
jgi:hypothetical protein